VRRFHPPAGKFEGVIGGPPCQKHSGMRHLALAGNGTAAGNHGDQIPEYKRVVEAARPKWFLMENVPGAYSPEPTGYTVFGREINNRWLGQDQNRLRAFWFGLRDDLMRSGVGSPFSRIEFAPLESPTWEPTVLAGHGLALGQRLAGYKERTPAQMAVLQGLPEDFLKDAPFTVHGKKRVIGNGVPLPMGRAIARSIKQTLTPLNDA